MSKSSAFPAHRHALQEQQPFQPCKGLRALNALLQSTAGASIRTLFTGHESELYNVAPPQIPPSQALYRKPFLMVSSELQEKS